MMRKKTRGDRAPSVMAHRRCYSSHVQYRIHHFRMFVLGAVLGMGFEGLAVVKAQDAQDSAVVVPWFDDEVRQDQLLDSRRRRAMPRRICGLARETFCLIELLRSAAEF